MNAHRTLIVKTISELTGLPTRELVEEAHLEADLGLDSLKMIGLWNNLFALIPAAQLDAFSEANPPQALARLQSLGDILALFETVLVAPAGDSTGVAAHHAPHHACSVAASGNARAAPGGGDLAAVAAAPGQAFPMLPAQRLFLVTHQMVDSTSLCSSLELNGPLDLVRARQAWQALVERHPALRTVFHVPAGARSFDDFSLRLLPNPPVPELACLDLSGQPPQVQNERLELVFHEQLNRRWELTQWPLHEISVVRLSAQRHVLHLANEHIVSDGLSNQLLLRDFMALYQGQVQSQGDGQLALRPTLSATQLGQCIERIAQHRSDADAQAYEAFAKGVGRETCVWNPDRLARTAGVPQFRNLAGSLSRDDTAALQELAAQWGSSLYALMLTTFAQVADAFDPGSERLVVQLPTSGKLYPEVDIGEVAGCFAQVLSLPVARHSAVQPDTVAMVHRDIQRALMSGVDRETTRRLAASIGRDFVLQDGRIPNYLLTQMRSGVKSNLYFPFTGRTRINAAYGELSAGPYRAGTTNVSGTVDFLHEIHQEQLHLFLNWDALAISESTARELMRCYLDRLRQLAVSQAPLLSAVERTPAQSSAAQVLPQAALQLEQVLQQVLEQLHETLGLRLGVEQADKDLESRLGVDSLERVRLCMQLGRRWRCDPQSLLDSRSLLALAEQGLQALHNNLTSDIDAAAAAAAAAARPTLATQPVQVLAQEPPAAPPGAVQRLDPALPPMPYMHIEQQARRTPHMPAVQAGAHQLTYAQLDENANRLANHLRAEGVGRGDLVAVICQRGPGLLTAILAVQKAGACYVPVDPSYPSQRMQYIVGHAQARHLVFESAAIDLAAKLPAVLHGEVVLIAMDDAPANVPAAHGPAQWRAASALALARVAEPDDLMVVLYTSGSTGHPKGVALGHRGYMNRLQWHHEQFQLAVGGKVAQKTSCCFDISVWELFWPVMVGGTVCAADPETVRNPWAFATWMRQENIQVAHFVPSMFTEFVQAHLTHPTPFPDLKWLIFSGEALPVSPIAQWMDLHLTRVGLANLYGPTEASIDVTCHLITQKPQSLRIPIGAAIDGCQLVVVNDQGDEVPEGEMGELCLGGVQLAQGYLHDPVKTDASFVANRHAKVLSSRLYRTGDLAVQLPNGEFDYRGRIDGQVKIRGFRVELGEIEAVLEAHPAVREAAVLALPVRGALRLVAWVALDNPKMDDDALRQVLRERLPDYMVPHQFWREQALPKNHNGKLDRGVLRQRFEAQGEQAGSAVASNPAVQAGQTPAATSAALTKSAELTTPSKPTTSAPAAHALAHTAPTGSMLPLAPAQKWVVHHLPEPFEWWGTSRVRVHDTLDVQAFVRALNQLIGVHAALRTTFKQGPAGWVREIASAGQPYEPEFFDATAMAEADLDLWWQTQAKQAAQALRLDRWPLMSVQVAAVAHNTWDVMVVMHHLIGDMVAGNLMFKDLWSLYDAVLAGHPRQPAPVPGTEDLVRRLSAQSQATHQAQRDYWMDQFPTPASGMFWPRDHATGRNDEASEVHLEQRLPKDQTQCLLSTTKTYFDCSVYALLVTPLYAALAQMLGTERVVVSHRVHGRNGLAEKTYIDSIDNFAVNYPLALQVPAQEPMQALIERFQLANEQVPLRGVSYDWLAEQLPHYAYPDHRLTPVRVNYLGNLGLAANKRFEFDPQKNNQRLASPDQLRGAQVEVWFSIQAGELVMRVGYSAAQYKAASIQSLCERYWAGLRHMLQASPLQVA